MDIHQDTQAKNYKDRELLARLAAFAVPHWRVILLALAMAGLLVAATLTQPYIIKVAIDDKINGLFKPMAVVQTGAAGIGGTGAGEAGVGGTGAIGTGVGETEAGEAGEAAESARERLTRAGFTVSEAIVLPSSGEIYFRLDAPSAQAELPAGVSKAHIYSDGGVRMLAQGWPGESSPAAAAVPLTAEQERLFRHADYIGFFALGLLFLLVVVAVSLLNFYQTYYLERTGQLIIYNIRRRMFDHMSRMPVSYYDKHPVGRLVTRVSHDVEALNQLYSQVIVNLLKDVCMIVGIVIVMLMMNVKLALVSFAVIPVLVLITYFYRGLVREAQRRVRMILSRLNAFLAENLSGIRIIQIFNREERQNEAFTAMNESYYKAGMRGTVINSIFKPTIGLVGHVALAVVIWYGGRGVLEGAVTFGVVYAFTQYVQQFFKPLMGLADRYNQIQTAMASAERVFDTMEEESSIVSPDGPVALPPVLRGAIEFDGVWFAYEPDRWVLQDVSFTARPGETVAFVGATGAGKSSVISLINRFYDIQRGSVRLDGVDVRELDMYALRRRIGIIQQEAFVFTGDVYFNIRMHRADISDEDIEQAARSLRMHDFISRLPDGFRTMLGEQGYTLSSGQKQMLAFLRVYVAKPDILVLDEATAHVDSETEQLVQQGLERISRGRTTLIVAHRLSTIRGADKIIVMSKGSIREVGHHDELVRRGGYYSRLYHLQQQGSAVAAGSAAASE